MIWRDLFPFDLFVEKGKITVKLKPLHTWTASR